MKKIFILLLSLFMTFTSCQAAVQMKVVAMEEFKTETPSETIDVRVLNPYTLGEYNIGTNAVLHCQILSITDPKRGKRNAVFFVKPLSYTSDGVITYIKDDYYGKYSKFVLSKEEIKEIPPGKVISSAAITVGNFFVKGLSTGVAFVQGFAKNEKNNRFKSGVSNAYEKSILSYISEGHQLDIKVGDDFYLVFKTKEDEEEEAAESENTEESGSNNSTEE